MRLASLGLALTALTAVSACAPYAGTYGYAYQTGPVASDYGYAEPGYIEPGYAQPYATPYYGSPVAGAVIVGGGGRYDRRRDGWDDRRGDRREYDRRESYRRNEDFRSQRYSRPAEQRAPEQRQRPVFANQPAPVQAPRANIPAPPSGGAAFTDWSNRNINNSPGPTTNGGGDR